MSKNADSWPRGEVKVVMIGLIERINDSKGSDVSLDPLVLERMATCAHAVSDIWYPDAHIARTVELLTELRELRDAAIAKLEAANAEKLVNATASAPQEKPTVQKAPEAARPCSFGPYHVVRIGEVYRLLDVSGNDILRNPSGIRRVAAALNAFRKVPDPAEYRTAIEADCKRLAEQRSSAWVAYEGLAERVA